jgi:hypothetical protein
MGNKKGAAPSTEIKSASLNDRRRAAEEEATFYANLLKTRRSAEVEAGLKLLEEQRPVNLENIKESCISELQKFINQRGAIDSDTGKVSLPLMSVFKPNEASTIKRIETAQALINAIQLADSIETLHDLLQQAPASEPDLGTVICRCIVIGNITEDKALASL